MALREQGGVDGETNTDGVQGPSHDMGMAGHMSTHEGTFPNFGEGEGSLWKPIREGKSPQMEAAAVSGSGVAESGELPGRFFWGWDVSAGQAAWAWWALLDLVPEVMGH